MKFLFVISLHLFLVPQVAAQPLNDTLSFFESFKKGNFSGQSRYYFSFTDNSESLTDYHAHAAGVYVKYETAPFQNIQVGAGGSFVAKIGSSDLTTPHAETGQVSRYEIGLFDVEHPERSTVTRLEELYLKYQKNTTTITFGKQFINTPFIHPQDARMRPTVVEGLFLQSQIGKTKVEAAGIYKISPRSTGQWFTVNKSIGIYPQGINTKGNKNNYKNNLESKGVLLAGLTHPAGNFTIQIWDQWVENIFNSLLVQADYLAPLAAGNDKFIAGIQFVKQNALANGGNTDQELSYFERGGTSATFGARVGWKNEGTEASFNFNRITAAGRYLMPREWGRDPFYTFLPRERNDGFGDVYAYMIKVQKQSKAKHLRTTVAAGYYKLPGIENFHLNKYGLPAYYQFNADIRYGFIKKWAGLEAQFLYVYKLNANENTIHNRYVINKVNMSLYNLIINYSF